MAETISVHIHGTEYNLRGDDAERVKRAAVIVDQQMRDVAQRFPSQPPATVAVLAALNTAELLIQQQEQSKTTAGEITTRIDALTDSLHELLASST